jgi:predicted membrane protein
MKDYKDSYITTSIKSILLQSVMSLIVMPFVIIGLALTFILILIYLFVMWPFVPFFVYVERKKELAEENKDD